MVEKHIMKIIGKRIRMIRTNRKMTIQQLADASDISKSTISNLERIKLDNINVNTLLRISDALNIEVSSLLSVAPSSDNDLGNTEEGIDQDQDELSFGADNLIAMLYPPEYIGNYRITNLPEFLLVLPLIQPSELYFFFERIKGNVLENDEYVLEQINKVWKKIPESPEKTYVIKALNESKCIRRGEIYDKDVYSDTEYTAYLELVKSRATAFKHLKVLENDQYFL